MLAMDVVKMQKAQSLHHLPSAGLVPERYHSGQGKRFGQWLGFQDEEDIPGRGRTGEELPGNGWRPWPYPILLPGPGSLTPWLSARSNSGAEPRRLIAAGCCLSRANDPFSQRPQDPKLPFWYHWSAGTGNHRTELEAYHPCGIPLLFEPVDSQLDEIAQPGAKSVLPFPTRKQLE